MVVCLTHHYGLLTPEWGEEKSIPVVTKVLLIIHISQPRYRHSGVIYITGAVSWRVTQSRSSPASRCRVSRAIRRHSTVPGGPFSAPPAQGIYLPRLQRCDPLLAIEGVLPVRSLSPSDVTDRRHDLSLDSPAIDHLVPGHFFADPRKSGLSALQLSRDLGVICNVAWKPKHMVPQVMHDHNQGERLSRRIEIDDAYLGGEELGRTGRGAVHKFPFVAAVQTNDEGHPMRAQFCRVSGFTLDCARKPLFQRWA
jgi:hypothetical protein